MDNKVRAQLVEIGSTIKNRRKQKGYRQAELAKNVGVSTPTMGYLERAVCATKLDNLLTVCNALDLTIEIKETE